jgi:hypothetical protein
MRKEPIVLVFSAALAGAASFLGSIARHEAASAHTYEDVYYAPPPSALRVMTLGHREAMADLLWCRALVYMGEEYGARGTLRHVFDYTDLMLTLDPDFLAVYRWIGTAGVYQPDAVTVAEVERSIAIMERGRQRFPADGPLAWTLGATLNYELTGLLPPEERDAVRLRGAEHILDAVRLGAAPEWVILNNTALLHRLGQNDRAIAHLEQMYATVSDERVRAEIATRIADLRSSGYEQAFVEANDNAEEERLRTFPYMHPSLFFLVGSGEDAPARLSDGVLEANILEEE